MTDIVTNPRVGMDLAQSGMGGAFGLEILENVESRATC